MLWLGGALPVLGRALTHFSCKLGLKKNFHRPGGAGAPTAPPGYAYEANHNLQLIIFSAVKIMQKKSVKPAISIVVQRQQMNVQVLVSYY